MHIRLARTATRTRDKWLWVDICRLRSASLRFISVVPHGLFFEGNAYCSWVAGLIPILYPWIECKGLTCWWLLEEDKLASWTYLLRAVHAWLLTASPLHISIEFNFHCLVSYTKLIDVFKMVSGQGFSYLLFGNASLYIDTVPRRFWLEIGQVYKGRV